MSAAAEPQLSPPDLTPLLLARRWGMMGAIWSRRGGLIRSRKKKKRVDYVNKKDTKLGTKKQADGFTKAQTQKLSIIIIQSIKKQQKKLKKMTSPVWEEQRKGMFEWRQNGSNYT